jgi:hypothetical protein
MRTVMTASCRNTVTSGGMGANLPRGGQTQRWSTHRPHWASNITPAQRLRKNPKPHASPYWCILV